jgi:hypothetical protein
VIIGMLQAWYRDIGHAIVPGAGSQLNSSVRWDGFLLIAPDAGQQALRGLKSANRV